MAVVRLSFMGPVVIAVMALAPGCARQEPAAPASLEDLASASLATIEGELTVPGLEAPVEVIRDETGIPHIYAQNDDDLFFAQGYVMAQDRLWQMEMWRRWHEGRLAEIFGPAAFDYDARTRLLMFRGPWDAAEWTSYHPDAERLFTDYANGVKVEVRNYTYDGTLESRETYTPGASSPTVTKHTSSEQLREPLDLQWKQEPKYDDPFSENPANFM